MSHNAKKSLHNKLTLLEFGNSNFIDTSFAHELLIKFVEMYLVQGHQKHLYLRNAHQIRELVFVKQQLPDQINNYQHHCGFHVFFSKTDVLNILLPTLMHAAVKAPFIVTFDILQSPCQPNAYSNVQMIALLCLLAY